MEFKINTEIKETLENFTVGYETYKEYVNKLPNSKHSVQNLIEKYSYIEKLRDRIEFVRCNIVLESKTDETLKDMYYKLQSMELKIIGTIELMVRGK